MPYLGEPIVDIYIPLEMNAAETRVPMVPEAVQRLVKIGANVEFELGLGASINVPDDAYTKAGAKISTNREASLKSADIVLRLNPPSPHEDALMKPGSLHISYLDPWANRDLVDAFRSASVSAVAMELIPRSTIAQKMDALSSQANLAGYVAVVLGASRLDRILPMMMTPSGTIHPARVFVIGAGVAGLQAIATARRLGARVEAFDTRPVVEEQVQSLGAKFLKVDLGETGQTKDGYAKALTEEQLAIQRKAMADACARADLVITTAQVFGRKAPTIITDDMIRGMQAGSVVVDLAVESGGNVEGIPNGDEVERHGVLLLGFRNLPGRVPVHASQMYASNLAHLIEHFWNKETKSMKVDPTDEIFSSSLVAHGGEMVSAMLKTHYAKGAQA